ncbi:MAG: hypothetical protein VB089_06420 [Anaerolineaceae bacterium]|nr:hypothetical protein [Anaerolineaceae bacterium]
MSDKPIRFRAAAQDQLNYITRANADQQLHVIVACDGRLDAGRLERAVRLAMERELVLSCRFVEADGRVYWELRRDLAQLEVCRVVACDDPQPGLAAFVAQPGDPCRDPLLQARLFRTPAGDTLCLKINHVAADGTGTKEAAYLVADTYRRLEADPAYQPGPGRFGRRSQLAIFRQAGLRNLLRYRPRRFGLPAMHFELPFVGEASQGRGFTLRRLSPADFRVLKAYAHAHGATLNDLLLAALYRAMFAQGNPPQDTPLPMQVSIDLRRYLPRGQEQPICNLSSALYPALRYTPGQTFEHTLADVVAHMGRWKARRPGLTGAMLIQLAVLPGFARAKATIGRLTATSSCRVAPLLLSNFGLLDEERLAFGRLPVRQAWMLGPVMFGHGLMLTASTYAGQMTLAMGTCAGSIAPQTVEGLLDRVWQELAGLGSPPALA